MSESHVAGESTPCSSARACESLTGKLLGWQIKGRSSRKAIAVCVAEVEDIQRYGDTAGLPEGLLQKLLPGPVTIVLKRLESAPVCNSLTPDLNTLVLRLPGPDVCGMWKRPSGQGLSFCRAIASSVGALALTSANPSNSSSSLSPQEFRPLWEQLAYVFDGGIPPFCSCFQRRCLLVEDMFVCFCCCLGGDCPAEKNWRGGKSGFTPLTKPTPCRHSRRRQPRIDCHRPHSCILRRCL